LYISRTVNIMTTGALSADQQQIIIGQYKRLRAEQQALASKIGELEIEAHEHSLVLQTVGDLPGSRRCFRLIGGVLVERSLADIVPSVQRTHDGIRDIIKQLREQFLKKGDEVDQFAAKYQIRPVQETDEN